MPTALVKSHVGKFIEPIIETTTAAAAGAAKNMPGDFRVSITDAPGADAYPIASFTWLLVYKDQPNEAKGGHWSSSLVGHPRGAKVSSDAPLCSSSRPVVAQIEAKIKQITFAGKPCWLPVAR